ncbi:MAG: M13-type metalloendopeptidase [Asticcacaulis sp.]|uniref:M13 family metallopeptidase n=1 Tax=Asticcacaulis sp. TaxID=1872648 RepID=UPI0039E2AB99
MKLLKILACSTALTGLAASVAPAHAAQCFDVYCHMQSLESLDGFIPANAAEVQAGADGTSTETPHYGTWGIDISGMDTSVKPGDNFYDYVNGTATKNIVIPDDRTSYGSFVKLAELSEARSKAIVMDLATKKNLTGNDAKIAAAYNAMMDEARVETLDFQPIQHRLNDIAAIKTKAQMAAYMGKTATILGRAVFDIGIDADAKDPTVNALSMGQSGLGLPNRDFYLEDKYADKLAKYEIYVADMLGKTGYPDAKKAAHDIVAMETAIAKVSWTNIERRDPVKTYNPMKLSDLPAYAPGFDWAPFFTNAGVAKAKKIVLNENTAIQGIAKVYADTSLDTLKAWEAFRTIDQAAPYMSKRFVDAQWQFRSHELSGALAQQPRWKRGIGIVNSQMGFALGHNYVDAYFPADSKAKMIDLVADLRVALKARIENLTWMSPETKAKALEKLSKYTVKIGYPDKWRDYSKLTLKADDLIGNVERSSTFSWNRDLAKLDKPVDKTEWGMTPQTVNAYYNPTGNEIVFPAAILQPPFFDPNADMAVNFGGIGGVIGHEITHGFDDQGRHFDGDGKLQDWWTEEDGKKFDAEAKIYGEQYDQYEVAPGFNVKGGQTMGENIADLGGNLMGLDAYHLYLKGTESPVLDGFTGDQRVFMGFAQVWRSKYRLEALKLQVTTDPHSPAVFRVIGPVRNIDAWYKAFNVQLGDKYYIAPEDRVRIW